ncbi:acyl-CoA dehydratase activase [Chloroflexota bacterium]
MDVFLGIDVGSVTTKIALLDSNGSLLLHVYEKTEGQPVLAIQKSLWQIKQALPGGARVCGTGTTGSARHLAGAMVGADLVKNEISCHAVAALKFLPEVKTIIEIGGQDSKIIIIRDGVVTDFGMNTVCAAGTGSFIDSQARRLNLSIEEFAEKSLAGANPVAITGRCTVFAESDMIHKQQMGYPPEDIIYGLCQSLACNYLNNVGKGKEILTPVLFQGGVAFNQGIVRSLGDALGYEVIVPAHHEMMGAIGTAILVRDEMRAKPRLAAFRGFGISQKSYGVSSFVCETCEKACEIAQISEHDSVLARWGGRCEIWEKPKESITAN